ncbi:hypothetical protein [Zavarzinia aquatilis]|uniref:Uncharacterized protein n=1 Tax=Zavarzinia aquatilis TaxID=2211142 RepID=A0A317DSQ9_9PROT|nr:hypothetical protein [Zavarzinia aquatilis]PWR17701.1 hypothetical protein DKG74_20655 [Zavarzinia aquatilis]
MMRPIVDYALDLDAARRALDAEINQVSGRMGKRARLRARQRMQDLNFAVGRVILLAAGEATRGGLDGDPLRTWVAITAYTIQCGLVERSDLVEAFNALSDVGPGARA